jgi:hypothetical protein
MPPPRQGIALPRIRVRFTKGGCINRRDEIGEKKEGEAAKAGGDCLDQASQKRSRLCGTSQNPSVRPTLRKISRASAAVHFRQSGARWLPYQARARSQT